VHASKLIKAIKVNRGGFGRDQMWARPAKARGPAGRVATGGFGSLDHTESR
jgi:hypothetical protein